MNPKIKKNHHEIYNCLITFYHSISKQIKQSYFISKEIKQYTKGNKIRLKGNKTLGLVIFLLASRSPKTYGPMRCLGTPPSTFSNAPDLVDLQLI